MVDPDVFDVCAQIRLDWAKGRYDTGPSKKCPGGYSIPASKQCSGDQKAMRERYKTQGAQIGSMVGGAPGSIVGSKLGDLVAKRKLSRGANPTWADKRYTDKEWKAARMKGYKGIVMGKEGFQEGIEKAREMKRQRLEELAKQKR
jgi:hypothetical protein